MDTCYADQKKHIWGGGMGLGHWGSPGQSPSLSTEALRNTVENYRVAL